MLKYVWSLSRSSSGNSSNNSSSNSGFAFMLNALLARVDFLLRFLELHVLKCAQIQNIHTRCYVGGAFRLMYYLDSCFLFFFVIARVGYIFFHLLLRFFAQINQKKMSTSATHTQNTVRNEYCKKKKSCRWRSRIRKKDYKSLQFEYVRADMPNARKMRARRTQKSYSKTNWKLILFSRVKHECTQFGDQQFHFVIDNSFVWANFTILSHQFRFFCYFCFWNELFKCWHCSLLYHFNWSLDSSTPLANKRSVIVKTVFIYKVD